MTGSYHLTSTAGLAVDVAGRGDAIQTLTRAPARARCRPARWAGPSPAPGTWSTRAGSTSTASPTRPATRSPHRWTTSPPPSTRKQRRPAAADDTRDHPADGRRHPADATDPAAQGAPAVTVAADAGVTTRCCSPSRPQLRRQRVLEGLGRCTQDPPDLRPGHADQVSDLSDRQPLLGQPPHRPGDHRLGAGDFLAFHSPRGRDRQRGAFPRRLDHRPGAVHLRRGSIQPLLPRGPVHLRRDPAAASSWPAPSPPRSSPCPSRRSRAPTPGRPEGSSLPPGHRCDPATPRTSHTSCTVVTIRSRLVS